MIRLRHPEKRRDGRLPPALHSCHHHIYDEAGLHGQPRQETEADHSQQDSQSQAKKDSPAFKQTLSIYVETTSSFKRLTHVFSRAWMAKNSKDTLHMYKPDHSSM